MSKLIIKTCQYTFVEGEDQGAHAGVRDRRIVEHAEELQIQFVFWDIPNY